VVGEIWIQPLRRFTPPLLEKEGSFLRIKVRLEFLIH